MKEVKNLKDRTSFKLLMGALIKKGYRQKAHEIILETMVHLKMLKSPNKKLKFYLDFAIQTLVPMFELKTKKVAAQKLKVPSYIGYNRSVTFALRWLLEAAEKRHKDNIARGLAEELVDVCQYKGDAFEKKSELYKEVDASRIYLKYLRK